MKRNGYRASGLAGITLSLAALGGCFGGALSPEDDVMSVRDKLGIVCEASLSIRGSFTQTAPQPVDVFGCWPVGIWRFTTQVVSNDCPTAPALEPEYVFEVTRDEVEETMRYAYKTDPTYDRLRMKVTSGGGGLCEGGFEIYSPDGKTFVNLKPALQASGEITGHGDYEVYKTAQW